MKYSTFFRDSTHILLTRDFISMMKEVPLYHQMNGGIHMNQLVTGKFIALKRKQKNLTQEQLAEKLGVSNKTTSLRSWRSTRQRLESYDTDKQSVP
jgi:DNA-binding transcriptional regulator YiaG